MEVAFFLLIKTILVGSLVKRPGVVISYIVFFQSLNQNIYEGVGLGSARQVGTLFFMLLIFVFHKQKIRPVNIASFMKNKITVGYLLISFYILVYGIYIGSSHEYIYFSHYFIPTFFLFFFAGIFVFSEAVLKDLFYGIIIFSLLSLVFLILFTEFSFFPNVRIDRVLFIEDFGFGGPIGQARLAGILAIFSFLCYFNLQTTKRGVYGFVFLCALLWMGSTGTRMPFIALILSLSMLSWLARKQTPLLKIITGILLLSIILFFLGFHESLLFERAQDLTEVDTIQSMRRYERILIFLDIFHEHIVFGLGPGGWGKNIVESQFGHPHNMLMEYVLEYGLVGLLSFLLIVVNGFKKSVFVIKNVESNIYQKGIAVSWVFIFLNLMVSSSIIFGGTFFYLLSAVLAGIRIRQT